MDVAREQPKGASIRSSPVHREALSTAVGIDGVSWLLRALLVDASARGVERVDERAYVPYVYLTRLGPARDKIWL